MCFYFAPGASLPKRSIVYHQGCVKRLPLHPIISMHDAHTGLTF